MKHQAHYFIRPLTIFIFLLAAVIKVHAAPAWKVTDTFTKSADTGFAKATALSRDGNTAIVAAGTENCRVDKTCAAIYVYVRAGKSWVQQAKLTAQDEKTGSQLARGYDFPITPIALSADGNTVLAAISVNSKGVVSKTGAVYVFVRTGKQWVQQQKLTLPITNKSGENDFGNSVAVADDGNTAVIGNVSRNSDKGSAFIFVRNSKHWSLKARLDGPHTKNSTAVVPLFGISVAISGDGNRVLIGSPDFQASLNQAYLYQKSSSAWKIAAVLHPIDKGLLSSGMFGLGVALSKSGATALIGTGAITTESGLNAYIFQFNKQRRTWYQEAKLGANVLSSPNSTNSLALDDSGNKAIIGMNNLEPNPPFFMHAPTILL